MIRKFSGLLLLLVFILVQGCSKDKGEASKDASSAKTDSTLPSVIRKIPIQDPTILRAQLPDNTLVYLRIPNILDFISSPKGDYLSGALADKQHEKLIRELHTALYERVLTPENITASPWHTLMLRDIRSPLELAILPGSTSPYPSFLLSMRLGLKSIQEVNDLLKQLAAYDPRLSMLQEMKPDGHAALAVGPLSIQVQFHQESHVLRIMAGLAVSEELFKKTLAELKINPHPPIVALENEIDESRHGLLFWMNLDGLLTTMQSVLPPEKLNQLKKGFSGISKLAFGWGVSKGKGRIKLLAEIRKQGLAELIPVVNNNVSLTTSGMPRTVFNVSLPDRVQLKRIEDYVASVSPESSNTRYLEFKRKFAGMSGFSIEDFIDAFGPEVIAFDDMAGQFVAFRVRDEEAFDKFMHQVQSTGAQKELPVKGKVKIYHLTIPSLWSIGKNKPGRKPPFLVQLMSKGNTHLYWYRDKSYVVMAAIPQMLRDRQRSTTHINLGKWIKENQRQDITTALLSLTSTIPDSPRRLYYGYLQLLAYLGDVAGINLAIDTLPSAQELRLPSTGTYGMQVIAGKQYLGVELVFENNPLEFLIGQNMTGIATIGVLAAIAIPAYNDYILRAKVYEAINLASRPKAAVSKYWATHGKFPGRKDAMLLEGMLHPGKNIRDIRLLPDEGVIVLSLTGDRKLEGRQVIFTPGVVPGRKILQWSCRGTVERKYLPMNCR